MTETIEGTGELERWDSPETRISVHYHFEITTRTIERPGFPIVAAGSRSVGEVRALSGEPLPAEATYRLFASDGEILKVKHVFPGHWVILAS